jgi:chlorite dismutase
MSRPRPASNVEPSLEPVSGGWHCSHLYYSFDHVKLYQFSESQLQQACDSMIACLDPASEEAPLRIQSFIVSGHKADFGIMMLDPDPLKIDRVHQRLMAGILGTALVPGYSFVSLTEISEYVQSPEQYGERLVAEGLEAGSDHLAARVKAYADRLEAMNRQRLTPEFPLYPAMCFYPMNKKRVGKENWFALPKQERSELMIEHARSGIAFAGKVSQLITVGIALEDWEWGVTLWAANPDYLKEIVYRMRFDEASARYAEFGPFLTGYVATADEILTHCQLRERLAAGR